MHTQSQHLQLWPHALIADIEKHVRESKVDDTHAARIAMASKDMTKQAGNPNLKNLSFFSPEEFSVFAEGVREAGLMGFHYTEASLRVQLQDAVRADLEKNVREQGGPTSWIDETVDKGGDIPMFGKSFMQK
jgi:hypothetical protein